MLKWINRGLGVGGGTIAKDAIGNDVIASEWLKNHGPGDRTLTQGLKVIYGIFMLFSKTYQRAYKTCKHKRNMIFLVRDKNILSWNRTGVNEGILISENHLDLFMDFQGDPTYLVVEKDRTLATYGINGVCTHLGCVVPWNPAENKFICPCHGSQYNDQGRVVRGPAPLVSKFPLLDILYAGDMFLWMQIFMHIKLLTIPWYLKNH